MTDQQKCGHVRSFASIKLERLNNSGPGQVIERSENELFTFSSSCLSNNLQGVQANADLNKTAFFLMKRPLLVGMGPMLIMVEIVWVII